MFEISTISQALLTMLYKEILHICVVKGQKYFLRKHIDGKFQSSKDLQKHDCAYLFLANIDFLADGQGTMGNVYLVSACVYWSRQ